MQRLNLVFLFLLREEECEFQTVAFHPHLQPLSAVYYLVFIEIMFLFLTEWFSHSLLFNRRIIISFYSLPALSIRSRSCFSVTVPIICETSSPFLL